MVMRDMLDWEYYHIIQNPFTIFVNTGLFESHEYRLLTANVYTNVNTAFERFNKQNCVREQETTLCPISMKPYNFEILNAEDRVFLIAEASGRAKSGMRP